MSTKKIKGRLMWSGNYSDKCDSAHLYKDIFLAELDLSAPSIEDAQRLFIIPADAESVERLVERVARDIFASMRIGKWNENKWAHKFYEVRARAVLKSIGLAAPKTKGKK